MLNLISGALNADTGSVLCDGAAIAGLGAHRIARLGVARTFQLVRVLETLTAVENVTAGLAFRREPLWGAQAEAAARGLLARVGLAEKADLTAAQFTYIDQKRLELARALALDPRVLLLDEWLAGLTRAELEQGIALIRSLGAGGLTIILVEHVMDAIRMLCDRCIVMNAGVDDRGRQACRRARRPGGAARISRRGRCLKWRVFPSATASTQRWSM